MTHDQGYPRQRGILWPLLFILFGIVLLFNNFGLVPWSVWSTIGQFWPLLLIFWGLSIFFGRSYAGRIIVAIIMIVTVLSVIAYSLSGYAPTTMVGHVYGSFR
jgi:hypothetical protein